MFRGILLYEREPLLIERKIIGSGERYVDSCYMNQLIPRQDHINGVSTVVT